MCVFENWGMISTQDHLYESRLFHYEIDYSVAKKITLPSIAELKKEKLDLISTKFLLVLLLIYYFCRTNNI